MICLVFLLPVPPDSPLVEVKEQAVEGGEVELTCSVPRSRPAATLRWYRDRKEIKGVIPNAELGPCGIYFLGSGIQAPLSPVGV